MAEKKKTSTNKKREGNYAEILSITSIIKKYNE